MSEDRFTPDELPEDDNVGQEEATRLECYSYSELWGHHHNQRAIYMVRMPPEMQAQFFREVDLLISHWADLWGEHCERQWQAQRKKIG